MKNEIYHKVVIVGGGSAGITMAARLRRARHKLDIAIIEPSSKHYYQPLWTLVGGGDAKAARSEREEKELIPEGVNWIQDYAEHFAPEDNQLTTRAGTTVNYEYLVVCPGIQIDWDAVEGLKENLGTHGIVSNYAYQQAPKTWQAIQNFKGGNAIFTAPSTPVKCGGAPQKIMYLADDAFRRQGVREQSQVIGAFAGSVIFGVPEYAETLNEIVARKQIDMRYHHDLVALDAEKKEATFKVSKDGNVHHEVIPFGMIHVTPPQSAPAFLKRSPLGNEAGWVEVDKHTLQHTRYANIFGLGDASSLPTSKTGAAVRKQAVVASQNLLDLMDNQPLSKTYDGYTSCPLVTGYGKLVLAEFDYDNKPQPTFPIIDQTKEQWSMYVMKKYGLPFLYWNLMLRGLA